MLLRAAQVYDSQDVQLGNVHQWTVVHIGCGSATWRAGGYEGNISHNMSEEMNSARWIFLGVTSLILVNTGIDWMFPQDSISWCTRLPLYLAVVTPLISYIIHLCLYSFSVRLVRCQRSGTVHSLRMPFSSSSSATFFLTCPKRTFQVDFHYRLRSEWSPCKSAFAIRETVSEGTTSRTLCPMFYTPSNQPQDHFPYFANPKVLHENNNHDTSSSNLPSTKEEWGKSDDVCE